MPLTIGTITLNTAVQIAHNCETLVVLHDEKYSFMSELIMTCYHLRKAIDQGQASAFEILEYYISMRYTAGDLDHIPTLLTRFVNEFQISLSVDSSAEYKGPYILTQVACNYFYKLEYLPGQFDQRANSASECIQLISKSERPDVRTAKVYVLSGDITDAQYDEIKSYVINPVESRDLWRYDLCVL